MSNRMTDHAVALADVDLLREEIGEYVAQRLIRNVMSTSKKVDERSDEACTRLERRIAERLNRIRACLRDSEPTPDCGAPADQASEVTRG